MGPHRIAASLKLIASKLEASTNPDRELVSRDIQSVISKIASNDAMYKALTSNPTTCEAITQLAEAVRLKNESGDPVQMEIVDALMNVANTYSEKESPKPPPPKPEIVKPVKSKRQQTYEDAMNH